MTKQLVGLLMVFVMFTLASGLMHDRKTLEMKRGKEEHITDSRSVSRVTLYKAETDFQNQTEDDELFKDCSPYEKDRGCKPKSSSMFSSRIVDSGVFLTALAACESGYYLLDIVGDTVIKKVVFVKVQNLHQFTAPPLFSVGSQKPPESNALKEDSLGKTVCIALGILVGILAVLAVCGFIWCKRRKRNLQESFHSVYFAEDPKNINPSTVNEAGEQDADSYKMVNEEQGLLRPENLNHPELMSGLRKEDQEDPDSASDSCPKTMDDDDDDDDGDDDTTKCINKYIYNNCSDVGYDSYNDDSSHNGDGNDNYTDDDDDEKCCGSVNGVYTNHDYDKSKHIYENSNDDNITVDDSRNNYHDVNGDDNSMNDINNDKTCDGVDGPDDGHCIVVN
ncbi:uncharacterized protein LOC130217791 isoform X2 [Danio aesculapii]|uniref:uncharacterized protein LOC130217791 isoform X2 n=1 Tax=Danio aesculapii TaxID=1142201 RepID=UPI0024BFC5E4|nr:uncharacterized protein LOC130217791 isoform X2 [Danio aesculapii]